MRIAFISRATLYSSPGGDTVQLMETAAHLRLLNVQVDVFLCNEAINYDRYDLLHFFNIIRPADIIHHAKRSGKPFVVSTIFVDYGSIKSTHRRGLAKLARQITGADGFEYLKTVARSVKNGEKIMSKDYLLKGHRKAVQWVAKNAAMLLPNSESEYRRFVVKYKVAQNYCVIPNGIDLEAISAGYERSEQYSGAVICMGRIEDRKNQLRLIGAVNGTNYRLFIHGKYSPNSKGYYDQCVAAAGKNVTLGPHLEKQALYSAYSSAKVHVLPSYFETTGLSSLEAAAMGCNIVVTDRGDTRDYFGDDAWYCDPDDETSIREAIDAAYRAPYDTGFRKRILENFTWGRAAEKTLQCYQSVFSNEQPMKKEALAG
jgi:glycosyltransferase involved in cell wall biosynthesis